MTTVTGLRWRKARRSGNEGNCVEVAHTLDQVRDTKNRTGPVLHGDLSALVQAVKTGQISR